MDGAWVRYQCQFQHQKGNEPEIVSTIQMSFVGTVVEDGEKYRWVEVKRVIADGQPGAGISLMKILAPEKDILGSDRPFENALRLVRHNADGSRKKVDCKTDKYGCEFWGILFLWTPGMLKNSTVDEDQSKDIQYQQGRLKGARARTGKQTFRHRGINDDYRLAYTVWGHAELPFGYAEARIVEEVFRGETKLGGSTWAFRIQDSGTDAKSEIPDGS